MSTVLVLEEDPRTASVLNRGLRRDGHEVLVAEDADLSIFLASNEDVDVVVLDIGGYPEIQVLTELRRATAVPVVVLTDQDEPAGRAALLTAGASAVATKPFSVLDLCAEIGGQLAGTAVPLEVAV